MSDPDHPPDDTAFVYGTPSLEESNAPWKRSPALPAQGNLSMKRGLGQGTPNATVNTVVNPIRISELRLLSIVSN